MEYIRYYESPLGRLTLASDGDALTGLRLPGQGNVAPPGDAEERDLPVFRETERWLDCYFSRKAPEFTPPLRLRGTPFRRTVWEILLTIPFGRTVTYGEVAQTAAARTGADHASARAAGGAAGQNPVALIVPCHRVVGAGGKLTGYAGGLGVKEWLLRHEAAAAGKPAEA